jgi:hypothetical protein
VRLNVKQPRDLGFSTHRPIFFSAAYAFVRRLARRTNHRLENPGKIMLEPIEGADRSYFGEGDIIRIDDYPRL